MSRKRRSRTFLQTAAIAAVCVLFVCVTLVGLYRCISQPLTLPDEGTVGPAEDQGGDPSAPAEDGGPAADNGRKEDFFTILVGGLDDENGGSDTNMLVALDAAGGAIHVVSLPRDTLLNVDWTVKKLNNAYHHGGVDGTMAQVSNLLGIPVDFYVTVDLQAFVELVDAIGGVTFDVPLDMDYDDPYQDLHIHIPQGTRLLNGEEALQVVRWRQNNDGTEYATRDIGRIGTQQAFLKAVAKQLLQIGNVKNIPALVDIFYTYVKTDLTTGNLVWLGNEALNIGTENIHFATLPGDGSGYYNKQSVYVLDAQATCDLVNEALNPYNEALTLEDMDILVP